MIRSINKFIYGEILPEAFYAVNYDGIGKLETREGFDEFGPNGPFLGWVEIPSHISLEEGIVSAAIKEIEAENSAWEQAEKDAAAAAEADDDLVVSDRARAQALADLPAFIERARFIEMVREFGF